MHSEYDVITPSGMRAAIAARMSQAKRDIPHFRTGLTVEMDPLLALRASLDAADLRPSINDFIVKAAAEALTQIPALNIQWVNGKIHQFHRVDISVVLALDDGLTAPVIRNADQKSVWEISREIRDLAARARTNSIKMQEIVGGAFSVSNLGMFGVDHFDAIINPPQCSILAIAAIAPAIVSDGSGGMRTANVLRATLSADHRAVDGVIAARFLSAFRSALAVPNNLLAEGRQ